MPTRIPWFLVSLIIFSSSAVAVQRNVSPAITHQARGSVILVLSGRVLMEDGQPMMEMVQVDLVCNGRIRQVTPTAPDGTFIFEMGSPRSDDWLDPSVGGSSDGSFASKVNVSDGGVTALDQVPSIGRGRVSFSGCEVRLSPEAGFVSNIIPLTTRSASDNPDIGVIVVRRLSKTRVTTVSLSVLSAPKDARKAFEKATAELAQEDPNTKTIRQELEKAIKEYPEFSAAWDLLGRVQMSEGNSEEARKSFLRAVEEEPKFMRPYLGLGQMAVQAGAWDEAAEWSSKVLELDAGYPLALYWNGLANYYLSRFDQGEKSLSSLYQLGHVKEYPFGLLPLGVIHANQGKIEAAAKEIELYLESMPSEQVPDAQRVELENQLALWESQGLTSPSQESGPGSEMP